MIPCQQVTKLVAPFGYSLSMEDGMNGLNENHWRLDDPVNQRLLRHIDNLVKTPANGSEPIGRRWTLTDAGRLVYGLPQSKASMRLRVENEQFHFYLESVELYLFETNVGFLVFDVDYSADYTLDQIIRANYHLKKFTLPALEITYEETGQWKECRFSDTVHRMVGPLGWETFFEQDDLLIALVYQMALLPRAESSDTDAFEDWLGRRLFQMRRSFTDAFKASPEQYKIAGHEEVESVFQNSHWGVSMEAMANLAYLTGDRGTDEFFSGTYIRNVETTYFYLYILTLHQRYALLMLSILAARLPAQLEGIQDGRLFISELQERMAFFTLRGSFRQVSNVTHQSRLYDKLRSMLRIEELMDELDAELEVLSSLADVRTRRRDEQQRIEEYQREAMVEKRQARFHNYVMIMTTLFVVISTLADALTLVDMIQARKFPPFNSLPFYLLVAFSVVIGGLVLLMFIVIFSNWRFRRKHLAHGKK